MTQAPPLRPRRLAAAVRPVGAASFAEHEVVIPLVVLTELEGSAAPDAWMGRPGALRMLEDTSPGCLQPSPADGESVEEVDHGPVPASLGRDTNDTACSPSATWPPRLRHHLREPAAEGINQSASNRCTATSWPADSSWTGLAELDVNRIMDGAVHDRRGGRGPAPACNSPARSSARWGGCTTTSRSWPAATGSCGPNSIRPSRPAGGGSSRPAGTGKMRPRGAMWSAPTTGWTSPSGPSSSAARTSATCRIRGRGRMPWARQ